MSTDQLVNSSSSIEQIYYQDLEFTKLEINDSKYYTFFKRVLDIVGAIFGIIILMPLLILVAVLIKLEDPKGPVFFKQVRVGKNEEEFYMFKFRSMIVDAEEKLDLLMSQNEVTGAMFKIKKDPRVTNIGKFLRKTSIDELPQLLNVLKGEMSLVGPRPPLKREVKQYSNYEKQRLIVTPGCTGLWQVSGRSNLGFEEMIELDFKYIESRTMTYDIKIILKTIKVLLGSNDAY